MDKKKYEKYHVSVFFFLKATKKNIYEDTRCELDAGRTKPEREKGWNLALCELLQLFLLCNLTLRICQFPILGEEPIFTTPKRSDMKRDKDLK